MSLHIEEHLPDSLRCLRCLSKEDQDILLAYYIVGRTQRQTARLHGTHVLLAREANVDFLSAAFSAASRNHRQIPVLCRGLVHVRLRLHEFGERLCDAGSQAAVTTVSSR